MNAPNREEELEVSGSQIGFDAMEIIEQTGEKPEEGLLLETRALLLVHICQHKDYDG